MKIQLDELKNILDILIKKATEVGIEEVEIEGDNYWLISSDERENFSTGEPSISVGSLVDDFQSLDKIIKGINSPSIIDFYRLANLLIAIGEAIYKSKDVY